MSLHIIGQCRLTRDPEMRATPTGTMVCQFGIATNRKYGDSAKEESYFGDVVAFGKQAETVAKYFRKGDAIIILGRLKTESWDDKTSGEKKSKSRIIMESFEFPAGKPRDAQAAPTTRVVNTESSGSTDDIPF